jgi:hypothetical protein
MDWKFINALIDLGLNKGRGRFQIFQTLENKYFYIYSHANPTLLDDVIRLYLVHIFVLGQARPFRLAEKVAKFYPTFFDQSYGAW